VPVPWKKEAGAACWPGPSPLGRWTSCRTSPALPCMHGYACHMFYHQTLLRLVSICLSGIALAIMRCIVALRMLCVAVHWCEPILKLRLACHFGSVRTVELGSRLMRSAPGDTLQCLVRTFRLTCRAGGEEPKVHSILSARLERDD